MTDSNNSTVTITGNLTTDGYFSGDTITISDVSLNNMSSTINYSNVSTVSITGGGSGLTLDSDFNSWYIDEVTPFENGFPAWGDFQDMCREYPGLEKAFDNLRDFYKMCRDDWESKKRGEQ